MVVAAAAEAVAVVAVTEAVLLDVIVVAEVSAAAVATVVAVDVAAVVVVVADAALVVEGLAVGVCGARVLCRWQIVGLEVSVRQLQDMRYHRLLHHQDHPCRHRSLPQRLPHLLQLHTLQRQHLLWLRVTMVKVP